MNIMQEEMYNRALKHLEENIRSVNNMDEMIKVANEEQGFIKAMWCGNEKCEEEIKEKTGGYGSRCIPFDEDNINDKCVNCGNKAKHMVIWGKSY